MPWPYPIASVLGHGSRVLCRLEGVDYSAFLNFLMVGYSYAVDWRNCSRAPLPWKFRSVATHHVEVKSETRQLVERHLKTSSPGDNFTNISDGLKKKHIGLNIPIGGIGNQSAAGVGHHVGFSGAVMKRRSNHEGNRIRRLLGGRSDKPTAPITHNCDWLCISGMQSGHMYVRVDDHGQLAVSSDAAGEEVRRRLLCRQRGAVLAEHARQRCKVETRRHCAGALFFTEKVPHIRSARRLATAPLGGQRMLRVSSEPAWLRIGGVDKNLTRPCLAWFRDALRLKQAVLEPPPSADALRTLLEHYTPMSAPLYGAVGFHSIRDFWTRLQDGRRFLQKYDGRLRFYAEPVVLRLHWCHYVLMLTHTQARGASKPKQKFDYIRAKTLRDEGWHNAIERVLQQRFDVDIWDLKSALLPSVGVEGRSPPVAEETGASHRLPGLETYTRTRMVKWDIDPRAVFAFELIRLPVKTGGDAGEEVETDGADSRDHYTPERCAFTTVTAKGKIFFWHWVPTCHASRLQGCVHIGNSVQEHWVQQALYTEGAVPVPISLRALEILISRCAGDLRQFGSAGRMTLEQLLADLTEQSCHLELHAGRLHLIVERLLVRIRLRLKTSETVRWVELVRSEEASGEPNDNAVSYSILSTPKRKGEPWEDAAARCLNEHLRITPCMAEGILVRTSSKDHPCYLYLDESPDSDTSYSVVQSHYRWHLVTYVVKDENGLLELGVQVPEEGASPRRARAGRCARLLSFRGLPRSDANPQRESSGLLGSATAPVRPAKHSPDEVARLGVVGLSHNVVHGCHWVNEESVHLARGAYLWKKALARSNSLRVQSVLLGLEGSHPNMVSPFGMKHDAQGKSSTLSAFGCRKWRAFRMNNAIQVPADHSGLHLKVTKRAFKDLQEACEKIVLLDTQLDLISVAGAPLSRDFLNHRFSEAALFKKILGGSTKQAQKAISCFMEYRELEMPPLHHSSPTATSWVGEAELYAELGRFRDNI
eukprot:NODE_101_length_3679_cov_7.652309.p1 GENE.NODE_101_length_3679_cov_7.652309~~NODE_101_length_3679_cov_7.652309.p1  ORF type:complete len:1089 (+),score=247.62 NODE_101_length_3679_cov_7.652309:300-3269(+)